MMKRREFITALGGAAAWPIAARAQQQGERVRRIGVLMSGSEHDPEQQPMQRQKQEKTEGERPKRLTTTRASGVKQWLRTKPVSRARVESDRASDLDDARFGTFDPAGQMKADTSQPTPREKAQPGASMQGEPIPATPADEFDLPEGLTRQPMGAVQSGQGTGQRQSAGSRPRRAAANSRTLTLT